MAYFSLFVKFFLKFTTFLLPPAARGSFVKPPLDPAKLFIKLFLSSYFLRVLRGSQNQAVDFGYFFLEKSFYFQ